MPVNSGTDSGRVSEVPAWLATSSAEAIVPECFLCPLTGLVMCEPVVTVDGQVYENSAIEEWFRRGSRISPATGFELNSVELLPHPALQAAIQAFMAHPSLPQEVVSTYATECHRRRAHAGGGSLGSCSTQESLLDGSPRPASLRDGETPLLLAQEALPTYCPKKSEATDVADASRFPMPGASEVDKFLEKTPALQSATAPVRFSVKPPDEARHRSPRKWHSQGATPSQPSDGRHSPGVRRSRSTSPDTREPSKKTERGVASVGVPVRRPSGVVVPRPVSQRSSRVGSVRDTLSISGSARVSPPQNARATPRHPERPAPGARQCSPGKARAHTAAAPIGQYSPALAGPRAVGSAPKLRATVPGGRSSPRHAGAGGSTTPVCRSGLTRPQRLRPGMVGSAKMSNSSSKSDCSANSQARTADTTDQAGRTQLMHAAGEGDVQALEQQLSKKASVDARDECKCTALMYAATYGHIDAVRVLLDHGSNIEATSKDGWTSLITATYNGHIDVVQYLIQRDANIEAADERGWTPLMHVAFNGDIKTLKCLLENGASVEAMDTDGRTALVYAAFNGHAENVSWLLERCGTDASDSIDKALLFSSIHGHAKVVQLLLDAGAVSQETRHAARKLAGDHNHNHVVVLFTPDGQRDLRP
uniref:U-box domain-containing protein n=1 Tax=Noctiluca scintillans TaxID=2966 RepID=A0A7S1AY08_NOCSC